MAVSDWGGRGEEGGRGRGREEGKQGEERSDNKAETRERQEEGGLYFLFCRVCPGASLCVTPVRRTTRRSLGVARDNEKSSPSGFSDDVTVVPNKALGILLD